MKAFGSKKERMLRSTGQLPYFQRIRQILNIQPTIILPLWETTGTTAFDISGNGRNAAANGITWADSLFFDGHYAPYWPGNVANYVNILSALQSASFDPKEFTLFFSFKVPDWSAAGWNRLINIYTDTNNVLEVYKANSSNGIGCTYKAGGITSSPALFTGRSEFIDLALRCTKSGNKVSLFANGGKGVDGSSLGTWSGAITRAFLGSIDGGNASSWVGWIGRLFAVNKVCSDSEIRRVHQVLRGGNLKKLTFLGDSIIASYPYGWAQQFRYLYNYGFTDFTSHAVAAMGIITGASNMAAQVTASASDDADNIYVALGTNDTDTSDTLRSTYETNVNALKVSNPRAKIYGIGIFPRADMSGVVTKNGRIQTACTNTGATFVDTTNINYGGVTFDPAIHCSDGVHLNPTGATLAANWFMANYG